MIEAFGLKKYFPASSGFAIGASGWVRALDGVSVKVGAGETLGIVGESGSGKTTLAKIILLLERPTAGSLRFDGKEVAAFTREDLARYRRAVQAVFQDPYSSLNPRMRVGLRRDSAALYPHEFSGGQRQRIAIARALVTYPKFIVLDEPVSALDVSIRAQIMNLLKGLQEKLGLAYVIISHDLAAELFLEPFQQIQDLRADRDVQ